MAVDVEEWVKTMERIAKETYEGKLKPGQLDRAHVLKTYEELRGAVKEGYGKNWMKPDKDTGAPNPVVLKMQQNIFKFSGAKDAVMLQALNQNLGKDKHWKDFKEKALRLSQKYNTNYLQAEWQTAKQAGYHANNWQAYQSNKDLYPNLKYKTQNDGKVRKEHEALHNTVAPLDSSFWRKYYPPNGWRCRCYTVQTAEGPNKELPQVTEKDVLPEFRINVGISGQVFSENPEKGGKPHPYFALAKSETTFIKAFEALKPYAPTEIAYKAKNGAKVTVNPFADIKDLPNNLESAKKIADRLKIDVNIRQNIDTNVLKGYKNAEYDINGYLSDLKSDFKNSNYKGINNAFKAAKKQGLESVVFDFTKSFKQLNIYTVNRWILSNINETRGKQYREIIFIYKDEVVIVDRESIINKQLIEELKKLKANS